MASKVEKQGKKAKVTIDLYSLLFPEGALEFIFNAPRLTWNASEHFA